MPRRILGLSEFAVLLSGVAITGLSVAALSPSSSENLLRSTFKSALADLGAAQTQIAPAKIVPQAGTEDFWLSAMQPVMRNASSAPLTKTVSVGDRVTMTISGVERHLEISNVAEFEPKVTAVDTTPDVTRFVLVTARDSSDAKARPIRFAIEIQPGAAPLPGTKTARAL